jgi:hypothetical protein
VGVNDLGVKFVIEHQSAASQTIQHSEHVFCLRRINAKLQECLANVYLCSVNSREFARPYARQSCVILFQGEGICGRWSSTTQELSEALEDATATGAVATSPCLSCTIDAA